MKRTIGSFMNTFYEENGVSIWEGIKKTTEEKGYNLICFVGGALKNPHFNNISRNAIFDLASIKNINGIIAYSVSLISYIEKKINILEVVYSSGFMSKSTFYKMFKKYTHLTPTDYRNKYINQRRKEGQKIY